MITKDQLHQARIGRLLKQARKRLTDGYAHTLDSLVDCDSLTDAEVIELMNRLDAHPLIKRDSDFPRRWVLK